MSRPSPFANIPRDKENDMRFLLERVYSSLSSEIDSAVKARVGEHEGRLTKLEASVKSMEVCPCGKRHDPGTACPLYTLENVVFRSKARNAGLYSGFFMAGMIAYYVLNLIFQYMKVK